MNKKMIDAITYGIEPDRLKEAIETGELRIETTELIAMFEEFLEWYPHMREYFKLETPNEPD